MEEKKRNNRIIVSLSDELMDYVEDRARVSGQSKAAVVGLALLEYYEQKKAISTLQDLIDLNKKEKRSDC